MDGWSGIGTSLAFVEEKCQNWRWMDTTGSRLRTPEVELTWGATIIQ